MATKQKSLRRHMAEQGQSLPLPEVRAERAVCWQSRSALFAKSPEGLSEDMTRFEQVLRRVRPLAAAHRDDLAQAIVDLSHLLTQERADLAHPYWSNPRYVSAYLYYFLPWNLLRLTRLFANLALPEPKGTQPLLLDLGSGPATVPLALFLAKPSWRRLPLHIVCHDRSQHVLRLGKALLAEAAGLWHTPPWTVSLLACPVEQVAQRFLTRFDSRELFLVTQANVLNEVLNRKNRRQGPSQAMLSPKTWDDEEQASLFEQRLEDFLKEIERLFADGPQHLLCLEPGTRLGGKIMMHLREKAREHDYHVDAPCPHDQACPLLQGSGLRTWCHFTMLAEALPEWLEEITRQARLEKHALSLAPLLLRKGGPAQAGAEDSARILSAAFAVPGLAGRARYACSRHGLLLLENAQHLASGDTVLLPGELGRLRDRKSGALILQAQSAKIRPWHTGKRKKD